MVREAEDLFPEEKLEKLAELPGGEGQEAVAELVSPAELKCKRQSGDRVVDPAASPQELDATRDSRAEAIAEGIILSGEGDALARCVERRLKSLSDSQVIELENANFAVQTRRLAQLAKPCLGIF